jgi:membrane fusion protein, multidrug efflux system
MILTRASEYLSSRRGRAATAIAGVAVLALGGYGLYHALRSDPGARASPAIPVEMASVKRADVPVYVEGLGTVQAFYTVTVTARVDGQLDSIGFTEGQEVKKGHLLAQIDPRPFQAALDQARAMQAKDEAMLANARRDLARYEELAPEDLASKQTVDTQHAQVAQLAAQVRGDEASVANAATQLAYTRITAPIAGRTGIRQVDPGNNVRAADSGGIVVVTQLQPISVIFSLPEDALGAVNEALRRGPVTAIAVARNHSEEIDRGTVALVDNLIDQSTGTLRVKATFANDRRALWPGQFVNVRLLTEVRRQALTIPASALQRGPDGMFAYVVGADSTVTPAPLTVGTQSGDVVEVQQGLSAGQRVVTSNQYRLQPNAKVRQADGPAAAKRAVAADGGAGAAP